MHPEYFNACALALNFFSRLFLDAPGHELLSQLRRESLLEQWPLPVNTENGERGLALLTASVDGYTSSARTALVAEYTSLFIGPANTVPLWESLWTTKEKLLFDGPMFEVRDDYARYGLVSANPAHEPDDHFGYELSFLGGVMGLLADALENSRPDDAAAHAVAARDFMQAHLGVWAFDFLRTTATRDDAVFYRGAALLCEDTLRTARDLLASFRA